jgi:hypothetical protein
MSRAAAGSTQAIAERGPDHGRATRDGSGPEARFLLESPRALPRDLVPIRFLARPSGRGSGCWARKNGRQGWSLNHQVHREPTAPEALPSRCLQQVCRFQRPRRPPTTYLVSSGKVLQDLAGSRAQFEEIREFRTHNGLRRWSCPRGHFPAEPTSGVRPSCGRFRARKTRHPAPWPAPRAGTGHDAGPLSFEARPDKMARY